MPLARRAKLVLIVLLVLGAVGGAFWGLRAYWIARGRPVYRLAAVMRGEIISQVNSTGTVQAVLSVQIGSFVSGPIKESFVDYNSRVKKNEVMARIDERIYKAYEARDLAALTNGKANVKRVEALLQQAINNEERAQTVWKENPDFISDTEMDQVKFQRLSLEAELDVAKAMVQQADAALMLSQANLEYTNIKAPVDGIVVDRKIDPGQTVAAQFQTPVLFIVAPDLEKKIHVYATVDEADIGLIREAQRQQQPVKFSVDAYPDDLFEGRVSQVRMNSTSTQNVVTYPVVVESPNPDLKLFPGMTANLSFQVEKRENVLKIPNAALRYYPKLEEVRPEDRTLLEGMEEDRVQQEDESSDKDQRSASDRVEGARKRNKRHVWIKEGFLLKAVEVTIGLSDSKHAEMLSGALQEGDELVVGLRTVVP